MGEAGDKVVAYLQCFAAAWFTTFTTYNSQLNTVLESTLPNVALTVDAVFEEMNSFDHGKISEIGLWLRVKLRQLGCDWTKKNSPLLMGARNEDDTDEDDSMEVGEATDKVTFGPGPEDGVDPEEEDREEDEVCSIVTISKCCHT